MTSRPSAGLGAGSAAAHGSAEGAGARNVWLHFCCNDPDTGLFAGRIDAIQLSAAIDDEGLMLEIELTGVRPRALSLKGFPDLRFRAFGRHWPYARSRYGVGNWCWDAYEVTPLTAAELIARALGTGVYTASSGYTSFTELLEAEPVPVVALRDAILAAATPPTPAEAG